MLFFQTSSSTSDTQRRPRGACSWGFGARIASTARWGLVFERKDARETGSHFERLVGLLKTRESTAF